MTRFVCFTGWNDVPIAINPTYVICVFPCKNWVDPFGTKHKDIVRGQTVGRSVEMFYVRESYKEVLKAFEKAGVQIRKAKSNG